MYQDNSMMRGVMVVMKELEESLNELLYYDHEKFERDAMYDEGTTKEIDFSVDRFNSRRD